MAQRPTANADPAMSYQDFNADAPRKMTQISHETYLQTEGIVSAWVSMPGWSLYTCMHDLLHTIYLGFGRDLIGSLIADFIDHKVLGPGTVEQQLERLSVDMNNVFRKNRILDFTNQISLSAYHRTTGDISMYIYICIYYID